MNNLNILRQNIEKGMFPSDFPEFGGAKLIITSNPDRSYEEGDTIVYSKHAAALSWLVEELKRIYNADLNYLNKYDFYPEIGQIINKSLKRREDLFEIMLNVVAEIEAEWGTK